MTVNILTSSIRNRWMTAVQDLPRDWQGPVLRPALSLEVDLLAFVDDDRVVIRWRHLYENSKPEFRHVRGGQLFGEMVLWIRDWMQWHGCRCPLFMCDAGSHESLRRGTGCFWMKA